TVYNCAAKSSHGESIHTYEFAIFNYGAGLCGLKSSGAGPLLRTIVLDRHISQNNTKIGEMDFGIGRGVVSERSHDQSTDRERPHGTTTEIIIVTNRRIAVSIRSPSDNRGTPAGSY